MSKSVLSQVLQPAGVPVGIDEFVPGVIVLKKIPDAGLVAAIRAAAAVGEKLLISAAQPAALTALGVEVSPVAPLPSEDPLVAHPTQAVHGLGIAEGLTIAVASLHQIPVTQAWAQTAAGETVAGLGSIDGHPVGLLAGRWEDVAAQDDGAKFFSRVVRGETDDQLEAQVVSLLRVPGPEVEHPPVNVVSGADWTPSVTADQEINSGEFLREVAHAGRTLPGDVYDALVDFADEAPAAGALLIENMPLGDLPPTPDDPLKAHSLKHDRVSEFALLTVGRVLGRPVGYLPEHGGDVVQNISPTRKNADRQVSTSSKSMLEFHTEAAFHPHRPRYLLLLALRGDPSAATTLCSISAVLDTLSPRSRALLFQPRFTTGIDESYAGGRSAARSVQRPVLYGDPDAPKMWLDADLMSGVDDAAQEALDELARLVREHATSVTLKAGDLLVVDNDVAVHGRTPFTPRFDGTDRWLQRTFVVADHTAADGSRQGRVITTQFIA